MAIIITIIDGETMSSVRLRYRRRPESVKLQPAPSVINLIRPSSLENYPEYFLRGALRPCNAEKRAASLSRSVSHHLTRA